MKGLKDYRFKLVWASSFMGLRPLSSFSMPLEETCISGILECGLGLKEGFMPRSCWDVGTEGGGGLTESCKSSIEHPKPMIKLMDKKIIVILR